MSARISEPSPYPSIRDIFKELGASVVQEPKKAIQPDFCGGLALGIVVLMSVKIRDVFIPLKLVLRNKYKLITPFHTRLP